MIGNLNKKVQLLFFLFLPLIGLGQDFDFHDIKKIDSKESFKRFSLENLFVKATPPSDPKSTYLLMYGYKPEGEEMRSNCLGYLDL